MSVLLVATVSILGIISGRLLFKKWINHLAIYCVVWGVLIVLYEWKLLPYVDIIPLAWLFISLSFLSFLLGILTVISTRSLYSKDEGLSQRRDVSLLIFKDGGKTVKYSIIFFSSVCLFAAIQNWMVLIRMYGSIPTVILNASEIYSLSLQGDIKGVIPYISFSGYVAVFFSGIYTAYKRKYLLVTFFPLVGIIIQELATLGRAGMLFALIEFLFTFFLFRHFLNNDTKQRFKFLKKNGIFAFTILIVFFIVAASLVRISRNIGTETSESYEGTSNELRQFKDNLIISPSLYLYLSSDVGVLSQYLRSEGTSYPEMDYTQFGQNTFLPVYNFLSKFGFIDRVSGYQRGYFIPMWTNTGTYIRELHADFGITGILLGPYLIGLLITWLWFRFYEKGNIIVFAFLVYFNIIIGFSFLVMVTRLMYWAISLLIIIAWVPLLERVAEIMHTKSDLLRDKN